MSENIHKRRISFPEVVVIGFILSLFAAIGLSALQQRHHGCRRPPCLNNLYQIGLAIRLYAGDNDKWFPCDRATTTLGSFALLTNNYLMGNKLWICPQDIGVQPAAPTSSWTKTNLSYAYGGFGLSETVQPDTPIACDRVSGGNFNCPNPWIGNRWTHKSDGGNVLYADGHVAFVRIMDPPMYRGNNP